MNGGDSLRECLNCGMLEAVRGVSIRERQLEPLCQKCDSPLWSQTDGSSLSVDIAHQQETVRQALQKFDAALEQAWQHTFASSLRLIVGGGAIREAILGELSSLLTHGVVLDYVMENRGVILVRLR